MIGCSKAMNILRKVGDSVSGDDDMLTISMKPNTAGVSTVFALESS